jgi:hypothetical protein
MRRALLVSCASVVAVAATALPSAGRDRPFSTSRLVVRPELGATAGSDGITKTPFSKVKIEEFRCESAGNPTATIDLSCDTERFGQDFAPDNEIAVAVDPEDPNHILAGSNDYYYRFNNSTGVRQAIVPTGFFTSFDGGRTWIDGQIPMLSGNGAGDPAPAFDAKHDLALMAQLENVGGLSGFFVSQGDVSVSRSADGGVTWSEPVTVMQGTGAGIGPSNRAIFWDKEWLTVDNNPSSPFYGRAYVTSSRFVNGLQGSYVESAIYLSYSDDGGRTWTRPQEISGSHPSCTSQSQGALDNQCDEDQFSYPEVASDGTLYVHFHNYQNEAEWEVPFDFDAQIMVVKSTDGGVTFGEPVPAVQLEDGLSDTPWSVIGSQTVWGHQLRWTSAGNISVNPNDPDDVTVVFAPRPTPNPNATPECIFEIPGTGPDYDPCNAGPGFDTEVYKVRSRDGGATWGPRRLLEGRAGPGWFPWADHMSDGTLAVGWDEDLGAAPADVFRHVLKVGDARAVPVGPREHLDVSVTHWAGQYTTDWPAVCGPEGYSDDGIENAEGKDCNEFHGDYTGLAVDSRDRIHVVWTGLNERAVSPQIDPYTGELHDGFRQDAMYARR